MSQKGSLRGRTGTAAKVLAMQGEGWECPWVLLQVGCKFRAGSFSL